MAGLARDHRRGCSFCGVVRDGVGHHRRVSRAGHFGHRKLAASVAPGIAEALITTAAGLFAAIPAVIAYNVLLQRIKEFGTQLDDFALEFLNMTERYFVE